IPACASQSCAPRRGGRCPRVHACAHGQGNYASFAPSGKTGRKECLSVAGNRRMPPIGGWGGKSRAVGRWRMEGVLGVKLARRGGGGRGRGCWGKSLPVGSP